MTKNQHNKKLNPGFVVGSIVTLLIAASYLVDGLFLKPEYPTYIQVLSGLIFLYIFPLILCFSWVRLFENEFCALGKHRNQLTSLLLKSFFLLSTVFFVGRFTPGYDNNQILFIAFEVTIIFVEIVLLYMLMRRFIILSKKIRRSNHIT